MLFPLGSQTVEHRGIPDASWGAESSTPPEASATRVHRVEVVDEQSEVGAPGPILVEARFVDVQQEELVARPRPEHGEEVPEAIFVTILGELDLERGFVEVARLLDVVHAEVDLGDAARGLVGHRHSLLDIGVERRQHCRHGLGAFRVVVLDGRPVRSVGRRGRRRPTTHGCRRSAGRRPGATGSVQRPSAVPSCSGGSPWTGRHARAPQVYVVVVPQRRDRQAAQHRECADTEEGVVVHGNIIVLGPPESQALLCFRVTAVRNVYRADGGDAHVSVRDCRRRPDVPSRSEGP